MGSLSARMDKLARASPAARIGIAAACAQRVVPIFDAYWVGMPSDAPSNAIQLGWSRACGEPIDPLLLDAARTAITDLVAYYNEEGIGILARSVTTVLRLCEALSNTEAADVTKSAARACGSALHAAIMADRFINDL